ncbi:MAG TPA: aromatic ring-hydroxylating dioxygenase subunit alpha [Phenylobacterium sp.]|nr:aromatic ring-hydroxylating dioxygenase subunit alpha [Phenylobacterium sp.]
MLSEEKNRLLTEVGPGKPMGELLRRYWHPIAGVSEFETRATKPVRLMGEDLVLYKDLSGTFGLIDRHCPHRRADLVHGMVEACGLRCNYHGWRFDQSGACVEQPYEDTAHPELRMREKIAIKAYAVETKGGLVWAYLGPQPAPLLPDWEPFSWPNGFVQIVLSEVPCNWFQAQENSIDPVHFEWMHENWGQRLRGEAGSYGPTHLKLAFDEFEFGFVYKRVKEDTSEAHPNWTVGRVCLWPNGFFLGEHFEWRVPIDDENLLSVTWKFTRVPREQEPFVQASIPTWEGPVFDAEGRWITSHVVNQDFLAWAGQGRITDRTQEHLGASDRGVVMVRKRFFEELKAVAAGAEPKGLIRDPARNVRVELPLMERADVTVGYTKAEILADPRKRMLSTTYVFQAGQPERVREAFAEAMGLEVGEFTGLGAARLAARVDA